MKKIDDSIFNVILNEEEGLESSTIKPIELDKIVSSIQKSNFPTKIKDQLLALNEMVELASQNVIPMPNRFLVSIFDKRDEKFLRILESIFISRNLIKNEIYEMESSSSYDDARHLKEVIIIDHTPRSITSDVLNNKNMKSNILICVAPQLDTRIRLMLKEKATSFSMVFEHMYGAEDVKEKCASLINKFSLTLKDDVSNDNPFFSTNIAMGRLEAATNNLLYSIVQNAIHNKLDLKGISVPMSSIINCYDNPINVMYDAIYEIKRNEKNIKDITVEDVEFIESEAIVEAVKPDVDLKDIIGLDSVKTKVNRIAAYIKKTGVTSSSKHMAFLGNPGTGKTICARAIAKKLYEEKIVPKPNFVETDRSQLVGEFVGHTAKKTKEIFAKAKGGVLFIDEAYSLFVKADDTKDFGHEAVSTLIKLMEDNREDTIVIFAGYKEQMNEFINSNPGLKSRIQYTLEFEDYSLDELVKIMDLQLAKTKFALSAGALNRIKELIVKEKEKKEFGNGRFIRNLLEGVEMIQSERAKEDDYIISVEDVEKYISEMAPEEEKIKFGF